MHRMRKKSSKIIVSEDDYDYDDPFIEDDRKKNIKSNNKNDVNDDEINIKNNTKNKIEKIKEEIFCRKIEMNKILTLNLPLEQNIWFFENIRMLNGMEEYSEQWYVLRNKIYNKYNNIKNYAVEENENILDKIFKTKYTDEIKKLLQAKYLKLSEIYLSGGMHTEETSKLLEWIETVINIPIPNDNVNITEKDLTNIWNELNKNIYGMQLAKEKIMENICSKIINNESNGKIITLVGPYGVGKTSFAECIAKALKIPFGSISFNSIKEPSAITGFSYTYIGSAPGILTKILIKSKSSHMVILLDEVDKINSLSIESTLLNILDYSQNNRFTDHYMQEIPIDLSKIIFILSANNLENISGALLNRMCIINVNGYKYEEKIFISENFLIPKIKKKLLLNNDDIIIKADIIKHVIDKFNEDEGVRKIERCFEQIFDRLMLLKMCNNIQFSFNLNKKIIFPFIVTKNDINVLIK